MLIKLIVIFLLNLPLSLASDCQHQNCIAIVDAGSSGSRLHIYTYKLDQTQKPERIEEVWSKKIKPGLASLEPQQSSLDLYLNNLFSTAPTGHIPVYFYATAGMRMLPWPEQAKLYASINHWFLEQSTWQLKDLKTISGQEEGLYSWLATNQQLGRLLNPALPTVGVMETGGASVQIAFPLTTNDNVNPEDLISIKLYGRSHKLFIQSYLGLGQTEVSHQYLDNPLCFMSEYPLPSGKAAKGDAYLCKQNIERLINGVHQVDQAVKTVVSHKPEIEWYVIGGLAETLNSKPFEFQDSTFTLDNFIAQADNKICQKSWSELRQALPNLDYLYGYCLFPAYYYALLVEGYGIHADQPINYLSSKAGGGWALGVVLKALD